jgi:hypothetical protein
MIAKVTIPLRLCVDAGYGKVNMVNVKYDIVMVHIYE